MIKSLAHRAEAFNRYCGDAASVSRVIQEACFDMQIQFAGFFTDAINLIHGAGGEDIYREVPHSTPRAILCVLALLTSAH